MCESKCKVTGKATLIMLLGMIYLTGCTLVGLERTPTPTPILDPSLTDRSWYTGDPCLPPCWHGMEIGKTTFEEASKQIRSLPFIDPNTIWEGEADYIFFPYPTPAVPGKQINLYCQQPEGEICTRMWFVNDVLVDIFIFPNYHVTFLEVVQQLGEPDLVLVGPTHIPFCQVSILRTENQMRLIHSEEQKVAERKLCRMVLDSGDKIPRDLHVWAVEIITLERIKYYASVPWQGFLVP